MTGDLILVFLVIVLPGFLPGYVLTGPGPHLVLLAPLIGAAICALAGVALLASGWSILSWVAILGLLLNGASCWVLFRMRLRPSANGRSIGAALAAGLGAFLPLVALRRRSLGWDARSIWLFHARWFEAGPDFLRAAIVNPAFGFSHGEYPPLIPATVASVWHATGSVDYRIAQIVIGLLNACAVALIGCGVGKLIGGKLAAIPVIGGAVFSFGVLASAVVGTNGYADFLWSASAAAAGLYALVLAKGRSNLFIGLICACVAGLTKLEGFVVAFAIVSFAMLRHRENRAAFMGGGISLALIVSWQAILRLEGALLDPTPALAFHAHKLPLIWTALREEIIPSVVVAGICTAAGFIALRKERRLRGLGSTLWLWLLAAVSIGLFTIVGMAIGSAGAHPEMGLASWPFFKSANRYMIFSRTALSIEVLCWGLVGLDVIIGRYRTRIGRRRTVQRRSVLVHE